MAVVAVLACLSLVAVFGLDQWRLRQEDVAAASQQTLKPAPLADGPPSQSARLDFTDLTRANPDIVAWLTIEGTDIDYPVVQASDNQFYLTRTAERRPSRRGAIFLDYSARPDFSDANSVIHGHNLKDGAMFAQLERFKDREFFDRQGQAWLYRPGQTLSLEVMAVAVVDLDSPLYDPVSAGPDALSQYRAALKAAARHWRDLPFDPARDRLVTWSTCSYEHKDARTIVTAKVTAID